MFFTRYLHCSARIQRYMNHLCCPRSPSPSACCWQQALTDVSAQPMCSSPRKWPRKWRPIGCAERRGLQWEGGNKRVQRVARSVSGAVCVVTLHEESQLWLWFNTMEENGQITDWDCWVLPRRFGLDLKATRASDPLRRYRCFLDKKNAVRLRES